MAEYTMSSSFEKASPDTGIYAATVELESQITRLGSLISELDEKANRHILPQPELALKVPTTSPDEVGNTDAAKRQWNAADDVRRLANRLESLISRLDLL